MHKRLLLLTVVLLAGCSDNVPPVPPPTCVDCSGPCQVCLRATCLAADAGLPAPGCGAYRCGDDAGCLASCAGPSDCQADAFCDAGVCEAFRPLGTPCVSTGECASRQCADGVCCDTACSENCDRCDLSGDAGTCIVVPSGAVGSPSCTPYVCSGTAACPTSCTDDSSCEAGTYCDGVSCVPALGTGQICARPRQCSTGACADGVCCDSACAGGCETCDQAGAVGSCTLVPDGGAGTPSCAPYLCSGTSGACPSTCAGDTDCAAGSFCRSNTCVAAAAAGQPCTRPAECTSGFCADGVCCGTPCTAACAACDLAGAAGTCGTADAGRPGRPSCAPFVCGGAATSCPTTCATTADCAPGFACSGTACLVDGDTDGVADVADCAVADPTRWTNRTCYADGDLDTVFAEVGTLVCSGAACPAGTQATAGTDCDDDAGTRYQRLPCYGASDTDSDLYFAGTPVQTCTGATCPAGSSSLADCDDGNASAKPGQMSYFNTSRADGSYDYDCDGAQTKEPAWDCLTDAGAVSICSTTPFAIGRGFVGASPACGASGTYWANGVFASPACADLSFLYNSCFGPVSDGGSYMIQGVARTIRCK